MAYGRRRRLIKRFLKSINYLKITIRALFIFLFACISFISAYGIDEGKMIAGFMQRFFADIFGVFAFPLIFIFYRIGYYNWTTYFVGLFVDSYLYAVAIGIFIYFLSLLITGQGLIKVNRIGFFLAIIGLTLIIISRTVNFATTPETINDFYNSLHNPHLGAMYIFLYSGFATLVIGMILFNFSIKNNKELSIK